MPVIYLNTASGEGQKVFEVVQAADCPPLTLVAISGLNWNRNMAHWDGPAAFKRGSLSSGARMTTGGCWWRRSCQKQKRTWLGLRHGGDHRVLSGGTICGVCHLSDGCVLWGVHVRFCVVSGIQGVHLLPRAEAPAGLYILLSGGTRKPGPATRF